ncbi:MAG: response regulator [Mariprofundaceae bacterium]|nr:response regulator [Mariprofundaceae bacterium]
MAKILVVDDNPDNRDLICDILEDADYDFVEAADAELGLASMESEIFDLVLMDVSLPGMNGLDATKNIKDNPQHTGIPVFLLTAHAMQSDIDAGKAVGADSYITKPIDEDKLLAEIEKALD